MVAVASIFYGEGSNMQTECKALFDGLNLVQYGLGDYPLLIESDSQILVMMVHGKAATPWKCRRVLRRICEILGSLDARMSHIYCEANGVADFLALYAVQSRRSTDFSMRSLTTEGKLLLIHDQTGWPVVLDKPASVRTKSLLIIRTRRSRLSAQKYDPRSNGPKVPFFSSDEETLSTSKGNALLVPRENPRAFILHFSEQWPLRANGKQLPTLNHKYYHVYENGNIGDNGTSEAGVISAKLNLKPNGMRDDHSTKKEGSCIEVPGCKDGQDAGIHQHEADVEPIVPKLRHSNYYTEPQIQELATKERLNQGSTAVSRSLWLDNVAMATSSFWGRQMCGNLILNPMSSLITVRRLCIWMTARNPQWGKVLTSLQRQLFFNIKCIDKKRGKQQYIDGPKVDKYREMLIKKVAEQGGEFVAYDPVEGEWKF
ncbi:unnamed protein product [Ilex paraguariensis]|uniref:RNase H type-1 domain-containing protein n=1 Tax=Ilex paraguariensis TaxID=185542 RepID=A0ABC8UKF2_9AQUA